MVLSVCRRVLRDPHDAHDAFQATFLVLVRKAGSIRRRKSVGGWLFGIARRVAARARLEAARRRHRQTQYAERPMRSHDDDVARSRDPEPDYGPLIAEIDRLPERFRTPVMLHYFEGLSTEAIAQRLGCPRGTILSRLARARERLRRRLEQRGVSLEALMPATAASSRLFSSVAVPTTLVQSTVRAGSCLALAGTAIENVVPATVAALSRGVVRNLMFAKVRLASVLVILGIATAAIGLSVAAPAHEKLGRNDSQPKAVSEQSTGPQPNAPSKASDKTKGDSVVIRGQVLDPDGKAVAGAKIVLDQPRLDDREFRAPEQLATSGVDGRFEVTILRKALERSGPDGADRPSLAALAAGLGPDWVKIDPQSAGGDLRIRLRRDDVPIEGRIIGLEGRPMPGLTVSLATISEFSADLLKKLRDNAGTMNWALWDETRNTLVLGNEGPVPAVRTGPDGRFRLTGVGRDRVAVLFIEGESIEQSFAMVLTSRDATYKPILMPADNSGAHKLQGPKFDLTVAPGLVIDGVIRDSDTGRPIAGAKVRSWWVFTTATSDAQGRFRLTGQPKKKANDIPLLGNAVDVVVEGQPYFKVIKPIADSPTLGPIHVEIPLKRGVWVEGKVASRGDGRPVKAVVQYHPFRDNPHLKECPDASILDVRTGVQAEFPTDADGHFRALALPGGGILTVRTSEPGYLAARPLAPQAAGKVLHKDDFMNRMNAYQALVPINPGDGDKTVIPDIVVAPGRTQHVQVVGPDGRPVPRIRVFGKLKGSLAGEVVSGSEFTFIHSQPGTVHAILVDQQDESAGGLLLVNGDEPDPIRMALQPTGSVVGRLVDEEGRPRPSVPLSVMQDLKTIRFESSSKFRKTDAGGRFRITGFVPGITYWVIIEWKNPATFAERTEGYLHAPRWTVKPGEAQDWGDVQVKEK